MRIALAANLDKVDAVAAAQVLLHTLGNVAGAQHEVRMLPSITRNAFDVFDPDMLILLGGDGTILQAARLVKDMRAALVGINFGKLGYLASFTVDEFRAQWPNILAGKLKFSERLMLEGAIYQASAVMNHATGRHELEEPIFHGVALNDVVVNAGVPFRMVQLTITIDGHDSTTFRGDGLIVSTSSGSTGYNLSAGGPVIAPDLNAIVITPICPHSLSFRPVVVPDTTEIGITPLRVNSGTHVSFDGQVSQPLVAGQYVVVRRAKKPLRLVENPAMSHWGMLANKLHWAQSPKA
ncbi:MAG: NAD(+)/NADH kinase [Phycisphaerae bacterium]